MQICGNKELVKDSIQELFSELWNNKKSFIKVKSIKPYLFKSLKRKIKRELGKKKYLYLTGEFELETSYETTLIKDQQDSSNKQSLNKALQSLTPRQREAIYLRFYDHLSYEDIATILKVSTKATYKLIYRALSSLKEVATKSF